MPGTHLWHKAANMRVPLQFLKQGAWGIAMPVDVFFNVFWQKVHKKG
jgi:hypothetical protein